MNMRRILLIITTFVLLAAACSGGGSDFSTAGSAADAPTALATEEGGDVAAADSTEFSAEQEAARTEVTDLALQPIGTAGRDIIRTGRISTLVDDVSAGVNEVTVAGEARGGFVFGQTVSLEGDRPNADIVLKVPASSFDQLMKDLSAIGEVKSQESSAEDVTDQKVDIESRLTSAQASVDRVRGFLEQATTVDELTRVEAELTRREADLESLQGRLAVLEDQTTLSTITMSLVTDPDDVAVDDEEDKKGFAAGFDAGRDAFFGASRAVLAVVGFSLPFIPVLALAAAGLWLIGRNRRKGTAGSVVGAEA